MPDNLDRNWGFLLNDAARLLRKRFDQRARGLGLTRAQWQVLAHVNRQQGLSQSALADILEVEPITLVRLVDRLEASGLLERRAHPKDRRVRLLHLTDKARPVIAEMQKLGVLTREEAMAGLSAEDQERLIETLIAIKANLTERVAPVANPPAEEEDPPAAEIRIAQHG
jgi:MarR family transcriptional regulator, transcriptional regulator for hemolysin